MKRSLSMAMVLLLLAAGAWADGLPRILHIDDDNGRIDWSNNKPLSGYFSDALSHMGFPKDTWAVVDSGVRPDTAVLNRYDIVIWDQPDYYAHQAIAITDADTTSLGLYLQRGGKLWAALPDIGLYYLYLSAPGLPSWLHVSSYRLDFTNEAVVIDSIIGIAADSLGDGFAIDTDPANHLEADYTDRLRPADGAAGCFTGPLSSSSWNTDSTFYCAVRFDSIETGQKMLYLSTAYAGIPAEADRDTLMARVMGWFGWSPYSFSDAKMSAILQPGTIVSTNRSVPVAVRVESNNVNRLNGVWAHALVESLPGYPVYQDSVLVDSIMPLSSVTVNLQDWGTGGNADTVLLRAWVSAAGDVNPANDTLTRQIVIMPVLYLTDFESGMTGWTGDWSLTTESASSGTHAITDWPYHNYGINSDRFTCLDTLFDLTPYSNITLSFTSCHWIEPGHDFGYVMVSPDGGTNWDSVASYTGIDTVWHSDAINLNSYHASSTFMLGFRMGSDALLNMKGWLIDDVVLTASAAKARGVEDAAAMPGMVSALTQIAPNPSNGSATIRFQVANGNSRISLRVYNLAGQLVRTVYEGTMAAGVHQLRFDGIGKNGAVASGVYFVRLAVGDFAATKRLTVLR